MNEKIHSVLSESYRDDYLKAYKVIVAGGRDFDNYEFLSAKLDEIFEKFLDFKEQQITIISGMAKGADTLATRYADEHKLSKVLFPANWKKYPRIAGFLRNEDMLSIATQKDEEIFRQVETPVFLYYYNWITGRIIKNIIFNEQITNWLKYIKDDLDKRDVYTDIENYLWSMKQEPISEPDNETKIISHGFDLKTSFRKM